jgi:hypothetical protein
LGAGVGVMVPGPETRNLGMLHGLRQLYAFSNRNTSATSLSATRLGDRPEYGLIVESRRLYGIAHRAADAPRRCRVLHGLRYARSTASAATPLPHTWLRARIDSTSGSGSLHLPPPTSSRHPRRAVAPSEDRSSRLTGNHQSALSPVCRSPRRLKLLPGLDQTRLHLNKQVADG